jgi:hypothetical protein
MSIISCFPHHQDGFSPCQAPAIFTISAGDVVGANYTPLRPLDGGHSLRFVAPPLKTEPARVGSLGFDFVWTRGRGYANEYLLQPAQTGVQPSDEGGIVFSAENTGATRGYPLVVMKRWCDKNAAAMRNTRLRLLRFCVQNQRFLV